MKFAKYVDAESVPEWRRAYLNYRILKKRLKAIEKHWVAHANVESTSHATADGDDHRSRSADIASMPARKSEESALPHRHASILRQNTPPTHLSPPRRRKSSASGDIFRKLSIRFKKDDADPQRAMSRPPVSTIPSAASMSLLDEVLLHASEPEQLFFVMLNQELEKISLFYDGKEKEAREKLETLKMQAPLIRDYANQLSELHHHYHNGKTPENRYNPISWFRKPAPTECQSPTPQLPPSVVYTGPHHMNYRIARSRLKKAITESYRSLELLRSYKILNETGFQKILKKFDKTAGWKASDLYMQKVNQYHWVSSNEIDGLIEKTEQLFIKEFADGHRRRGMKKLRLSDKEESYTATTWRVGFCLGLACAVFFRALQLAIDSQTAEFLPNVWYNMQIYGCLVLPLLFCLGFSINLVVWHRSHISYKFIFELDPRNNLEYHQFAELPSLMLLIMSIVMYVDFSRCWAPTISSELCPLILFVILLTIMVCPFKILYSSARRWLGVALGRIFLSYCFSVEFRDFFIADELNSLAYSFWTLSYFFCAYGWHWTDLDAHCDIQRMWVTPLIASLPPWWRFLQCVRRYKDSRERVHLINGAKYVTSILATVVTGVRRIYPSATMNVFWILCCILNSSYTSIWDIKMDWGLLQPSSQHFLLRDDLVFFKWTYYVAIPVNVLLRFSWAINMAGLGVGKRSQLFGFVTACLEAARRLLWNFFRLENEHLNNCGNYRAIKEIPLPFALTNGSLQATLDEEGSIQLPDESLAVPDNPRRSSTSQPPSTLQRAPTLPTPGGSFYGRRDFENKHDADDADSDGANRLVRQPSAMGHVLERIRSLGAHQNAGTSESDIDDEVENLHHTP